MATSLYDIFEWVKKNGEVKAIDRVRFRSLSAFVAEGVVFSAVTPQTKVSDSCLQTVRQAASSVVGQPCPL